MTTFTGTNGVDRVTAQTGVLMGFSGGSVAELQDTIGDVFIGGQGEDVIFAGNGNDVFRLNQGETSDVISGGDINPAIGGIDLLDLSGLVTDTALQHWAPRPRVSPASNARLAPIR